MAVTRGIAITVLLGVLVTAHRALVWQSEQNGTFTLAYVFDFKDRILPNTELPIRLPQTGYAPADNYLAFMMTFFWVALDTRNVRAHLQATYLLGTLSGSWLLMLSEAHRSTNSMSFFLLTYFSELMGEFLGIGMFTPLWCILHLFLTRVPTARTKDDAEEALSAPKGTLQALGYALVIGHAVPTFLTVFTEIDGEGLQSQQFWTIARLFHPVFVLVLFTAFKSLQSTVSTKTDPAAQRLSNKRKIYLFSMIASALGHMPSLGVLFAQHWIPNWLQKDVLEALDWKTIVLPVPFWIEKPIKQVPYLTGVATFLQWDNICAASAISIWAFSLYAEALLPHLSKVNFSSVLNVFVQGISITALAGPVAGAAFILQERDAMIVAYSQPKEIKKQ